MVILQQQCVKEESRVFASVCNTCDRSFPGDLEMVEDIWEGGGQVLQARGAEGVSPGLPGRQ